MFSDIRFCARNFSMSAIKQLTLPITGMTCANCVATVERTLKKLDGVQSAVVNLSSERATIDFESAKLGLADVIARVNHAGYGVAQVKRTLLSSGFLMITMPVVWRRHSQNLKVYWKLRSPLPPKKRA